MQDSHTNSKTGGSYVWDEPGAGLLVSTATAAVWLTCLVVGILGVLLPYARDHVPAARPKPVEVVQLLAAQELPPDAAQPQSDAQPPPPPDVPSPPPPADLAATAAPPVVAAAPSPAIAMPIAVKGPSQPSDAAHAAPAAAATTAPAAQPVQHLRLGVGEGRQPNPEYPQEAIDDGEQGTVVVRFIVGEDGQVESAQASQPCRFPLLNQAAVRVVRDEWRFNSGKRRIYEVPIEFRLNK